MANETDWCRERNGKSFLTFPEHDFADCGWNGIGIVTTRIIPWRSKEKGKRASKNWERMIALETKLNTSPPWRVDDSLNQANENKGKICRRRKDLFLIFSVYTIVKMFSDS